MELRVNTNFDVLNIQLAVSNERMDELLIKLNAMHDQLDGNERVSKAEVFKRIVEFCDTLEEVVLLIHAYTNYVNENYGIQK